MQKAITGGSTVVYAYDAFGQLETEYSPAATLSKDYIRLNGQVAAVVNAGSAPCTTCYFSYDHLGSVRMITDQNGKVIARHDYLPFGEEVVGGPTGRSTALSFGASDSVSERFTGQVRDSETGQDFFNARYFGAALGRFTSPDPMNAGVDITDPQTWNGYSYVRGNPLALVDPSGLDPILASCPDCQTTVYSGPPDPIDLEGTCWWCFTYGVGSWGQPTQPPPTVKFVVTVTAHPPNNGNCVSPSLAQRVIASGLSFLSRRTGLTLGYGTGGSIGAGRKPIAANYAISMQFVAAPDGTVGKQFSYTPNSASYFSAGTTGYGGLFGLQFSGSNARPISDLEGGGVDAGGLIADGLGIGGDVSVGSSGGRVITQGTLTVGVGFGGKGAAGVLTQTAITPFCQ